MTKRLSPGVCVALLLASTSALADDAACLDAAAKAQRLRAAHKLVEAREQLRVCASAACPTAVQSDCANWLIDVEKALPSIVVTAKNGSGTDLVDVKVSVDGQLLVSKLDGAAVPMNAGPHTFHFEGADGRVDQQVVVTEGDKNQRVAVVLGAAPVSSRGGARSSGGSEPAPDTAVASRPWRTVGWVLGGVGFVGLGLGTAFGVSTLSGKSSHCSNNLCDPGTSNGIKTSALISDVGWIAGGVLLASGAGLVLLSPSGGRDATTTAFRLAPVLAASGGGVLMAGGW